MASSYFSALLAATPSSNVFCSASCLAFASGEGPVCDRVRFTSGFSPMLTGIEALAFSLSFSAVMTYSPGKIPSWTNSPFLFVFTVRPDLAPFWTIETVAPSTGLPWESTILPLTMPVCAAAVAAKAIDTASATRPVAYRPSFVRTMGLSPPARRDDAKRCPKTRRLVYPQVARRGRARCDAPRLVEESAGVGVQGVHEPAFLELVPGPGVKRPRRSAAAARP